MSLVFLLSPARLDGPRGTSLLSGAGATDLARRLRTRQGAPLGEVFSFLSALYFRGKYEYARAFALPPDGLPGVWVITSAAGLRPAESPATVRLLERWAGVGIDRANPVFRRPLVRDARRLSREAPDACFVLLGSLATPKYVEPLHEALGERLFHPPALVGVGDMKRGSLLLEAVRTRRELAYARWTPAPPRAPSGTRARTRGARPGAGGSAG